jgi:hypothetical protein
MLDRDSRKQPVAQWIESCQCHVQLPEKISAHFERRGPVSAVADDVRSNARMHCSSLSHKAALRAYECLPGRLRDKHWFGVYPMDLGKKGCRFLHYEALYPCEQYELVFANGMYQFVEIMWCRRIDEGCYAIGSRFVSTNEKTTEKIPQPMAQHG